MGCCPSREASKALSSEERTKRSVGGGGTRRSERAEAALERYRQNNKSRDPFVAFLVTPGLKVGVPQRHSYERNDFRSVASPNVVDEGGFGMDADRAFGTGNRHSFVDSAVEAFSNHHPFVMRPQQIWLLLLQAVAEHVNQHAQALRSKWVHHTEGQKPLHVVRNDFVKNRTNDWASVVNDGNNSFAGQIRQNAINIDQLKPNFTGAKTNAVEAIAQDITVMHACQEYFGYIFSTLCGFPFVVMEGTWEDWKLLRKEAEQLIKDRCLKKWASDWSDALLSLLDKFAKEYESAAKGRRADRAFWNGMCKIGGVGGSGGYDYLTGWLNILFPYLREGKDTNPYCVAYKPASQRKEAEKEEEVLVQISLTKFVNMSKARGPNVTTLPTGLCKAPVTWNYLGEAIPLELWSGFVGVTYDDNGAIRPVVGWFVVYPRYIPQDRDRLEEIFKTHPKFKGGCVYSFLDANHLEKTVAVQWKHEVG